MRLLKAKYSKSNILISLIYFVEIFNGYGYIVAISFCLIAIILYNLFNYTKILLPIIIKKNSRYYLFTKKKVIHNIITVYRRRRSMTIWGSQNILSIYSFILIYLDIIPLQRKVHCCGGRWNYH